MLQIDKQTAKKLYPDAPDWMQQKLIDEYGAESFKPNDFENIKTFEDACKALMISPDEVFTVADSDDEVAYKKLKVIVAAINNGWKPDWSDGNQYKYYPYFKVLPWGSGFSNSDSYYTGTDTSVGSRLCFESSEKAMYAASQFEDLYKQFLTINN
jgi:hypothetical protein